MSGAYVSWLADPIPRDAAGEIAWNFVLSRNLSENRFPLSRKRSGGGARLPGVTAGPDRSWPRQQRRRHRVRCVAAVVRSNKRHMTTQAAASQPSLTQFSGRTCGTDVNSMILLIKHSQASTAPSAGIIPGRHPWTTQSPRQALSWSGAIACRRRNNSRMSKLPLRRLDPLPLAPMVARHDEG